MAGVKIPKFEKVEHGSSDSKMNLTGLGSGGQQVQGTRKAGHPFQSELDCKVCAVACPFIALCSSDTCPDSAPTVRSCT